MLVDSFVAVTLEAVSLPDLYWTGIAKLLQDASTPAADTEDTAGDDGIGAPDKVACLRVSGSAIASLQGLQGLRNLLALAVPRNSLAHLDNQVHVQSIRQQVNTC